MKPFSWHDMWTPTMHPLEVAVRAALIYVVVQLFLRVTGRRRLARASVFDAALLFLVTVSARRAIVGDDSSVTSAVLALSVIFGLDWLVSRATTRHLGLVLLLEGKPRLLVRDGQVLEEELERAHLSREELLSQLRLKGEDSLSRVREARLEPSGQLSFLLKKD